MNDYIIRKKKGNNYTYHNKKGEQLSKKNINKYLTFYIPPAYENVKINKKNGKIKAIGYDDKNRPQYIYKKQFTEKRNKLKFLKLIDFGKNYKKIYDKIKLDLYKTAETKDKQIATILMLIIECDFRVGNDKYTKQNKSYGVTTLESRHIKNKKNGLLIEFIGKKGVNNKCLLKNKRAIKNIKTKKRKSDKNNRIFQYWNNGKYHNIKSSDVNNYLKKLGNYSTKYFRTWSANISLIEELLKHDDLKKSIEITAEKLHHTPSICKKNYIDPKLIKFFENKPNSFKNMFSGDINYKYYQFLKLKY